MTTRGLFVSGFFFLVILLFTNSARTIRKPGDGVSLATFGWITATTVNPGLIQFALKYSF